MIHQDATNPLKELDDYARRVDMSEPSKMQQLLDIARHANDGDRSQAAISALIVCIELLSKGQQQVMQDLSHDRNSRTDIPIR